LIPKLEGIPLFELSLACAGRGSGKSQLTPEYLDILFDLQQNPKQNLTSLGTGNLRRPVNVNIIRINK